MKKDFKFYNIGMIVLGVFFIFSAITKMIPNVNYFDFTIESQLGVGATLSAILARVIIGVELFLGLSLLLVYPGKKKWILSSSLLMLIVFSLHLIILFFKEGNDINCGCMGDFVEMSPLASLGKNVLLIALNLFLLMQRKEEKKFNIKLLYAMLILPIVLMFAIFPMNKEHEVKWEELLMPGTAWESNENLTEGKAMVAFLSLTCGHCVEAAKKLNTFKQEYPEMPIYVVFQGLKDAEKMQEYYDHFVSESGVLEMPKYFADSYDFVDFLKSLGETGVPSIYWINDGKIFRKSNVQEASLKEFRQWIK